MSDRRRKLTAQQVSDIRTAHVGGTKTLKEIAETYGIGVTTAWKIINGFAWKAEAPAICPHCHQAIP
jgi:DNA invertase Pin-like site-specific DNA recombinase